MIKSLTLGASIAALVIVAFAVFLVSTVVKAERVAVFMSDFEKIHETKPALSIAQVEQLMGPPLRIYHAETTGITGDVYHYPTYPPGGDFKVIFVNGVVFSTAIPIHTPKS